MKAAPLLPKNDNTGSIFNWSTARARAEQNWAIVRALQSGTQGMRDQGETFLPKEPKEEEDAWRVRRDRSFLYEAYSDTVEAMAEKPFCKEVQLMKADGLPEPVQRVLKDPTGKGTDLTRFSGEFFHAAVGFGGAAVFINMPSTEGMSLAEERDSGARPVMSIIEAQQIIALRERINRIGVKEIEHIRIWEERMDPDGLYGDIPVPYVLEINAPPPVDKDGNMPTDPQTGEPLRGTWRMVKQPKKNVDGDETEVEVGKGTHSYPGVPVVQLNLDKGSDNILTSEPPMMALAWLNLRHWQTSSDQYNILRYARVPLLMMTGLTPDERDKPTTISASRTLKSTNPDAKAFWVEHTGKAIDAGAADIQHLEEQMEVMKLQPLIQRTQDSTAYGKKSNDASKHSDMQAWVRALESALRQCAVVVATWSGEQEQIPEDFSIDVYSDFAILSTGQTELDFLLKARQAGELSRETFLNETKRRGAIDAAVDVEEEIERIEADPGLNPPMDEGLDDPESGQFGSNTGGGSSAG